MKNLFLYSLILLMFISVTIPRVEAYSEPIAHMYEVSSCVAVSGSMESTLSGKVVSLLLIDKNADISNLTDAQIGYIRQTKIEPDGSYLFKFRFTGNIDNYILMINQAGNNVTKTVTKAIASDQWLKLNLNLTNSNTLAKAETIIDNLYQKENMTYTLILGFYSKDGRLIEMIKSDKKSINSDVTTDELLHNIPSTAYTIKAYLWDSIEKMIPLCTSKTKKVDNTIKILAIGNSFSENAMTYVDDLAAADGVDLKICNLYIPGCSLETHWTNASNDYKSYTYQTSTNSSSPCSIKEILESDEWDYVTLQQVSGYSGIESSYYPYIENLAKYVKTIEPNAELVIHQTWAYENGAPHQDFGLYNNNQLTMFNSLKTAYKNAADKVGLLTLVDGTEVSTNKIPLGILPSGQAFQNAREFSIFNTTYNDGKTIKLNANDGFHASNYGKYLIGAVWYEALVGRNVASNTFNPGFTDEEINILKNCAHNAVVEYGWRSY